MHSAFHRERYLRRGGTSGAECRALAVELGEDGTAVQLLGNRLRCEMQKSVDPSVGELEVLRSSLVPFILAAADDDLCAMFVCH